MTDPAIAGDPAPVDEEAVVVDPEPPTETDAAAAPVDDAGGEVLPPVEQVTAGSADATCVFGPPAGSSAGARTTLEQTCGFDETTGLPFEAPQDIELVVLDTRAVESLGATPFTSIADSGMLTAGYSYAGGGLARFVGVTRGTGDYNGKRITITGLGQGNVDATYDWTLDERLVTPLGASDASSEVSVEYEITAFEFDDEDEARTFDRRAPLPATTPGTYPVRFPDRFASSTRIPATTESEPMTSPTSRRHWVTTCCSAVCSRSRETLDSSPSGQAPETWRAH